MSEYSNEPMSADKGPASFFQTWITALTKPNEQTYAELAASPDANAGKAYLWVFLASLVAYGVSILTVLISSSEFMGQGGGVMEEVGVSVITLICVAPLGAGLATLGFMVSAGLIQWVAGLFGGTGDFNRLAYVFGAIVAPLSLISAGITLFSAIPFIGFIFSLVGFVVGVYGLVLNVMAVKGVNQFGWGQAVGSVFLPGLVFGFIFACLVIGTLMLMGPVIGDVFSEINQGLGVY